jgi:hypothetical protein
MRPFVCHYNRTNFALAPAVLLFLMFAGILPAAAQSTISGVDDLNTWSMCTAPACAGGNSTANLSWFAQNVTSFSQDGGSIELHLGGNQGGFSDARFKAALAPSSDSTFFDLDLQIFVNSNASAASQAFQFGIDQITGADGAYYRIETQCDFQGGSGVWRFWDAQNQWQATNLGCSAFSGWTHLTFHFSRVACPAGFASFNGECSQWQSVDIDGSHFDITHPDGSAMYGRPATGGGANDQLSVVTQLDGDSNEDSYEVYLDSIALTENSSGGGGGGCTLQFCDTDDPQFSWTLCGACGNDGGTGTPPVYDFTPGQTVAGRTDVRVFSISGAPSTGGYAFYANQGLGATIGSAVYEFDMYLPDSASAAEAIEAELQQTHDGLLYNMAWQFRYADLPLDVMELRLFNYYAHQNGACAGDCWEYSGITIPRFTPNTWYHIRMHFTISGGEITHDWIELTPQGSGVTRYTPSQNSVHQVFDIHPDLDDTFNNALQLDLNSSGASYSVYFDHVNAGYNQP